VRLCSMCKEVWLPFTGYCPQCMRKYRDARKLATPKPRTSHYVRAEKPKPVTKPDAMPFSLRDGWSKKRPTAPGKYECRRPGQHIVGHIEERMVPMLFFVADEQKWPKPARGHHSIKLEQMNDPYWEWLEIKPEQ
jgi:hypothetical protein